VVMIAHPPVMIAPRGGHINPLYYLVRIVGHVAQNLVHNIWGAISWGASLRGTIHTTWGTIHTTHTAHPATTVIADTATIDTASYDATATGDTTTSTATAAASKDISRRSISRLEGDNTDIEYTCLYGIDRIWDLWVMHQ